MKNKNLLTIFFLILIGFTIYSFNLQNQLFWDDDEWIKGNVFVHNFSYLKEIFTQNVLAGFGLTSNYYRPLLLLSFAFNYVIGGIAPFGYHLFSNGIHIANGILIFLIFSKFLNKRISFLASLIFLIHPAQTEAVSYISGRGDPLSVFFILLTLFLFLEFYFSPYKNLNYQQNKSINYPRSRIIYKNFILLLTFIAAILSRESAVLFPLLLIIFYLSFLAAGNFSSSLKRSFIISLPFWFVSIIYFILRLTIFNFENTLNFYPYQNIYTENLFYRLLTFSHALVDYFKIIFYPVGLHMERDLPIHTSIFDFPVLIGIAIFFSILFFLFRIYRLEIKNQKLGIKQQSSNFRIWLFSWSWFFISLAPVSGIIPINALIYEHWLYLPLVGLSLFLGFYIDKLIVFLKSKSLSYFYFLFLIFLISYFSFFAIQSIRRNILWSKPIEFYQDILKYNPKSVRILTNLGKTYAEKGDLIKAVEFYERAANTEGGKLFPQPYYNLGNIYRDLGRIDEAIEKYKKAIEVDPNFPFAYQNLAEIYVNKKQDLVSGIKIIEKLKEIQPGNPRIYYNLGLLYLATNNFDLAIKNLKDGLNLVRGRDQELEKMITSLLSRLQGRPL